MPQQKLIIANWKMNGSLNALPAYVQAVRQVPFVLCPPAPLLAPAAELLRGTALTLGAQDCHAEPVGAFTGDTPAPLLAELGVKHVILGHSERRRGHGESDAFIWRKLQTAAQAGLVPVLCVGEQEGEEPLEVLGRQLQGLGNLMLTELLIAYEPVWAIGTGRTPSVPQVKDVHLSIKAMVEKICPNLRYGVLYGGSVKPENALLILGEKAVDGVLVGAASLDPLQILAIHEAAEQARL